MKLTDIVKAANFALAGVLLVAGVDYLVPHSREYFKKAIEHGKKVKNIEEDLVKRGYKLQIGEVAGAFDLVDTFYTDENGNTVVFKIDGELAPEFRDYKSKSK